MEYSVSKIPVRLVETVLCSRHAADLIPGTDTHLPALHLVGEIVRFTDDPEWISDIVGGLLPPDYSGNTLREIPGMIADSIEKGFDKPANQRKSNVTAKEHALAVLQQTKMELFRTPENIAFVAMFHPERGAMCHPVRSEATKGLMRLQYHRATGKTISKEALGELIDLMEARAIHEAPEQRVHVRIGEVDGAVYYDLGRPDGAMVKITADGWSVVHQGPVRFYRPNGLAPQVVPERGGSLEALRKLHHLSDRNWTLLLAFLLACLKPTHPYPILLLSGERGSGKSKLSETINRILDPNALKMLRLRNDEHTLVIQASKRWLLVYDNTSSVPKNISDALCAMVTGSGFSTRQYYTDDDERTFNNARPIILNGIGEFANRNDLLDRTIPINLPPMTNERRCAGKTIDAQLDAILPGVIGCLFDIISAVLRNQDSVDIMATIRSADMLEWLVAAEPATGLPEGSFQRTLENSVKEVTIESINNNPLTVALNQMLDRLQKHHETSKRIAQKPVEQQHQQEQQKFEGTMGQLLGQLQDHNGRIDKYLPQTPQHLSNMLRHLAPGMAEIGLMVEFGSRTNSARPVRIWREPSEHAPEHVEGDGTRTDI